MSRHESLGLTSRRTGPRILKCVKRKLGGWPSALYGLEFKCRQPAPGEQELRRRLLILIKQAGIHHATLAEAVGVTRPAVSKALSGRLGLPGAWLPAIAAVLGTTTTKLLQGLNWQPGRRRPATPRSRTPRVKRPESKAEQDLRFRLRGLFDCSHLTHQHVATAIGVTRSSVTRVLTGINPLPSAWLKPIATLLNMPPSQLLGGIAWSPRTRPRTRRQT